MMKRLFNIHWKPSLRAKRYIFVIAWIFALLAIFWVSTFKIMDRDFWWHITAGKILLDTKTITIDPFAYTRAGLPYLATHEWLAQIILYLIYHTGGYVGIILFRGVIASTCVGLLLLLTKHKRFAYLALAVWAIVITKGSYLERPQLFTFVLFAAFLLLAFRFLDAESRRTQKQICAAFIVLELLWVNMHGGAALLGCAIVTFLLLQTVIRAIPWHTRHEHLRTIWLLLSTLVLMAITLVLPPNGLGTITYVIELMNDQTIAFIAEWQPRELALYLRELWPFFVLSLTALFVGRKNWVFNTLLLLMTAYLSRQAFRHEILFVYASIATCFYQFDRSERMARIWTWIGDRPLRTLVISILMILLLGRVAYTRSFGFERQDNLFGFGQFDLARGAYDFIEREKISGNMFNTYGIGGYLIYRGYPDRRVFIDGRNVDYGFDFMLQAFTAGFEPASWKELEDRYALTYAIVDYDAIKQADLLPYSTHLDKDTNWALVYLDDWVAVYVKKTPENQHIIQRLEYTFVSATTLQFHDSFSDVPSTDISEIIKELRRVQHDNPEGIKATVALAKIALQEGRLDDVEGLIKTASSIRPESPEPLVILAGVYAAKQDWEKTAEIFTNVLKLAVDNYPNMNYQYIADIFEQAGHPWKAWYYRLKAPMGEIPTTNTSSSPVSLSGSSLMANPRQDSEISNEQGIIEAEKQNFAEAEKLFRTAIMLNPSFSGAWNNLCALLLHQQKTADAIEACKRAIEVDNELADAHYNLALAYYYDGNLKDAEKEALLAKKMGREKESDQLLLLIHK
jgi:tetratricopeptide (TPR) repeat protein